MADDGNRIGLAREPASKHRRNAKDDTVIRGDDLGSDEFAHTTDFQIRFHRERCREVRKQTSAFLEILEVGIRELERMSVAFRVGRDPDQTVASLHAG